MINKKNLKNIFRDFSQKKILVLGDVMLDFYIKGTTTRISPEAPVPILKWESDEYALGGAGNVGRNVAALGGRTTLLGIVGNDENGRILRALARESGLITNLVVDTRPTTIKTRVVSMRHQLLRFDKEETKSLSGKAEREVIALIKKVPNQDLIIISDYHKGFLTKNVAKALVERFGGEKIIADIKPANTTLIKGVLVISPNLKEAEELTGIKADGSSAAARAAKKLSENLSTSIVLTRGEHGMTVFDKKTKKVHHLPAQALNIFNETGAGDTVIATLGLMLASGADLALAAEVSNHAAGIVVGEPGTTAVTKKKLIDQLT